MADRHEEPIFNAIHATYDNIRTTQLPAEKLPAYAKLTPGQRVLDVACGTGWATMVAARTVGDTGQVTGIDIADKLMDVAREKTASAGLSNVEFRVGDAEELEFDDASFDTVICASSIFIFKDILKALHEWRRVLKAGGTVAFSSWGETFLQPAIKLFSERLARYDRQAPSPPLSERTNTPDRCRELLKRAGFEEIEITSEQLGFYFSDPTAWWQEVSSMIFKPRLDRLSPAKLERFKADHLSEVESLCTAQGLWIDVPVHFSTAKKR